MVHWKDAESWMRSHVEHDQMELGVVGGEGVGADVDRIRHETRHTTSEIYVLTTEQSYLHSM